MNLFVLTPTHRMFQNFCHDHKLREHFGDGPQRMGQARCLTPQNLERVRGYMPALVLVPEEYNDHNTSRAEAELSAYSNVSLCYVPMCPHERSLRAEHARQRATVRSL